MERLKVLYKNVIKIPFIKFTLVKHLIL